MKRNQLLKIGLSETKRKDIKSTYIKYAIWLLENDNKELNLDDIFNAWKLLGIYSQDKKIIKDINREISLISKFGLGKIVKKKNTNNYLITASEVSKNIRKENSVKLWGMEHIDFFFFQLLLKQTYNSNGKKLNIFREIYNYLKMNSFKLTDKILINDEYESEIKRVVFSKNIEDIYKLIRYESGSCKNKDRDKLRNEIVKKFIELQVKGEEYLIHEINDLLESWKFNKFPEGFSILLFGENITFKTFISKKKKFFVEKLGDEIFFERIKSRIILASKSSYLFLIKSHLNSLRILFEFDSKDVLKIDFLQKEQIENILDNTELDKLDLNKYYSVEEFIKIFNINNKIKFSIDVKTNIIDEFYSTNDLIELLNSMKDCYSNFIEDRKKLNDLINNHPHIKGQCDKNTFFEYISGLVFLKKANKTDNDDIKKYLNMTLDSNFVPQRFAGPGMPDASIDIEKKIINVEPTTQLYRQTQMELDSSRSHLEKSMLNNKELEKGISVIVAPQITKKLTLDIKGWNEEVSPRMSIQLFDIDSLIEMLKSEIDIFQFIENHTIIEDRIITKF